MRAVLVAIVFSVTHYAGAQPVDVSTRGPQAGTTVPAFSLPDQDGRARSLASLLGPNGALLVFSRSADW